MRYTLTEWLVILGAYAYDYLDDPCMSDRSWDILCEKCTRFDENSSMWVRDMDEKLVAEVYATAQFYNRTGRKQYKDLHHPAVEKALQTLGIEYDD